MRRRDGGGKKGLGGCVHGDDCRGGFGEGLAVGWQSIGSGERWTGWMGKRQGIVQVGMHGYWFVVWRLGGGLGGDDRRKATPMP